MAELKAQTELLKQILQNLEKWKRYYILVPHGVDLVKC
jgi:hypothetical protein